MICLSEDRRGADLQIESLLAMKEEVQVKRQHVWHLGICEATSTADPSFHG